jgi:hypothetical protein
LAGKGEGRSPRAALTVRISRSATWHTTRAWVIWWPTTASVTSMSTVSPGLAYDRYCAVAHTHGRPDVASNAAIPAPRPQPPNKKSPEVEIPAVTGSVHRNGLCVGSRPRNVRLSIGRRSYPINVSGHYCVSTS